jgi:anaerobic ribonucleoside-triphosphate reductase activating protein
VTGRGPVVNVAAVVRSTAAEGPGARFALWVQGCPLRCAGCCNPEMIPFVRASPTPVAALLRELRETPGLDGLTLLGGEPFAQPAPLAILAEGVRALGLDVLAFSGYTRDELRRLPGAGPRRLLAACDLLVDGRFDARLREGARRLVGSSNQRLLPLTPRGEALAARWDEGPDVVEVRIDGTRVVANGPPGAVPASGAAAGGAARP